MPNFPPILVELWNAIEKIAGKLVAIVDKLARFIWGIALWLFERFVDLIKYIADKI